jgi:hypothetical protein
VFAVWALTLTRAWLQPDAGRFAALGLATAAAALTRPGYQVLVVFALVPLAQSARWRARLARTGAFLGVVAALLGTWTVLNGLRYEDYALARGGGAFFPFYRAFTTDGIVSPGNGEASRELAAAVQDELLDEEPYRSYGVTLERFFEGGGPREFEDVVGITDRVWGWDTDYEQMRAAGLEAVRAHPWRYARGVTRTVVDQLWSPLHVALPRTSSSPGEQPATDATRLNVPGRPALPTPSEGEQIPSARQGFFSTTPDGSIEEVWTSPTDHRLVFATAAAGQRFAELEAESGRLAANVPPYPGSSWLTLQFSRSSKLFPAPLLWLAIGVAAWIVRRPRRPGLAALLAGAALLVVVFQALAVYSIVEFAVPVAPALVVIGAAGLLAERRTR